ncbi:MAG TPA: hypothetical protein VI758_11075 [Bacteroidota bacterium]
MNISDYQNRDTSMYVQQMDLFVNRWFAKYEQARSNLEKEGGYLFPYKSQFFITESEAIRELGLDPEDPDWKLIGFDWVKPLDHAAWERLKAKRAAVIKKTKA